MWYIGIDPGKKGGLAVLDGEHKRVRPYSDEELLQIVAAAPKECICCLEKVHAMPGNGATSMFSFGAAYGYIKGALEAFKIPYQEIPPRTWKGEFGLNSDKQKSVEVCRRLFPDVNLLATPKCRVAHDGMAEALLLSEFARRSL